MTAFSRPHSSEVIARGAARVRLAARLDVLGTRMHFAQVVNLDDLNAQALAYPVGHAKGRLKRGSRYHHYVSRSGPWIFHPPQRLAVQGVDIQADRCGPALGFGV
jgi:hypothetical protein